MSTPRRFGCVFALCATALSAAPLRLDVSPTGKFTTLERARDALRESRRAGGLPPEGAIVSVAPGHYTLTSSLRLGPDDAGRENAPVRWVASPGSVVLRGGTAIDRLRPLSDPAVRTRLPAAVQDHVREIDLRAAGVTDFGRIAQRGNPGLELFFNDQRLPVARYPNDGWLLIAEVPQTGAKRLLEGLDRERRFDDVPVGRHYGRIGYGEDRPKAWARAEDIYVHGYWSWDWSDSFQRVESIDAERRELTLAEPHHHYGYTKNQRYYFLNVLEELDRPGEWYLDRARSKIYVYPPAAVEDARVAVSVLESPLIELLETSFVSFEGFTLEQGRGSGGVIKDGRGNRIAGCTLRNLGGQAIVIDGGAGHRVQSCELHALANGAIRVVGGDRETLTPSHHVIENNDIHRFSQWLRTGEYGVWIEGVGQRVAHNAIHDAPFEGMRLAGNDHVVEFNEFYRLTQETGDAGAMHTGRDWTWRGNIFRFNYWHDMQGPGLHGVTSYYLDDFGSGFTLHGNLFYRAGRAVQIGGGRDNLVENNLFVECDPAIHLDARGLSWASNYFDGGFPWLFDRFRERRADQPPYAERYPELRTILGDDPAVPKGNRIVRNIAWGGRWIDLYDFYNYDFHRVVEMRDNLIASPGFVRRRVKAEKSWEPYYLNIDQVEGYRLYPTNDPEIQREFAGNTFAGEAPGTFDPRTLVFTPRDPAAIEKIGFKPLPVEKMGLQRDQWRTQVPAREPVR